MASAKQVSGQATTTGVTVLFEIRVWEEERIKRPDNQDFQLVPHLYMAYIWRIYDIWHILYDIGLVSPTSPHLHRV